MLNKKDGKHVMIVENSPGSLAINESAKVANSSKLTLDGKFTEFDIENRNKRMYTAEKFVPYMNLLLEKKKTLGVLYGEYDHPDVFDITCKNLSHAIINLTHNESMNCVDGSIELLPNHWGREARSIIEGGYPLFVSSRAAGVTDERGIVHLKELFTYDLVADPGFASARVMPKLVNESLGYGIPTDEVPYRIYEMDEAHVNALFNDNKHDGKTHMDIKQFEAFLQGELRKIETQLMEKITSRQSFDPAEVKNMSLIIEGLKEEIKGVNKVLEFFKGKINYLLTDNSKLKDENKQLRTEVSENLMHSNHLSTMLKNVAKYTNQIDERLNLNEGLLEHVAKHSKANIYFSKDIANNLSSTASELTMVKESINKNSEALLYVINDNTTVATKIAGIDERLNDVAGFSEDLALEVKKDNVWLHYIHEKVDGVVEYAGILEKALKTDNNKINENSATETEIGKLEGIDDYLGLPEEQAAIATLMAQPQAQPTEPGAQTVAQPSQPGVIETEPQAQPVATADPLEPVAQPAIDPMAQPTMTAEPGIDPMAQPVADPLAQPTMTAEPAIDPLAQPANIATVDEVQPTVAAQPPVTEPTGVMSGDVLNQLVKIIGSDDTGVVVQINPETNVLTIQKSGSDETVEHTMEEVEVVEYTTGNVLEKVTNVLAEVKKQKALAEKAPHFFSFLSEQQVFEFRSLAPETQANIIIEMADKEYYNATDVLGFIAESLNKKTIATLVDVMPADLKESWKAIDEKEQARIITESKYFPLATEAHMVNFWNTRTFAKKLKTSNAGLIVESVITNKANEADQTKGDEAFLNAFNSLK